MLSTRPTASQTFTAASHVRVKSRVRITIGFADERLRSEMKDNVGLALGHGTAETIEIAQIAFDVTKLLI